MTMLSAEWADAQALQAAADRLSPQIIRQQLDHWTWAVGPKFSQKDRAVLDRTRYYSLQQIEYCRNFVFRRNFPIHKLFERSCDLGLSASRPTSSPRCSAF